MSNQIDNILAGFKLLEAIFTMPPIEERRVDLTEANGLIISTVQVFDIPGIEYETAIMDKTNEVYTVERYVTVEEAKVGHQRWIGNSKEMKTIVFLGYPGVTNDREIVLKR